MTDSEWNVEEREGEFHCVKWLENWLDQIRWLGETIANWGCIYTSMPASRKGQALPPESESWGVPKIESFTFESLRFCSGEQETVTKVHPTRGSCSVRWGSQFKSTIGCPQDPWNSCQMPDPKIVEFGDFPPHRISKNLSSWGIGRHRFFSVFLRTLPQAYYIFAKKFCAARARLLMFLRP